ncbi:MAG: YdcF family protein [Acidobacteria bacterium]|nr:YdcF family protein [Acidobacteriota bacterium]
MLDAFAQLIKLYLLPGSPSFLLAAVTVALGLLFLGRVLRPWGLALLSGIVVLYWALSLPAVASPLATRFRTGVVPRLTAADVQRADAIVVLGAGVVTHSLSGYSASVPDSQTVFNAFEGARLYHLAPVSLPVIASGGIVNLAWQREPESGVIRDLLVRAGVPADRITLESSSRTTHEQAVNLAPMIREHGWTHVIVVAPSVQMPRAVGSFAAQGVHIVPAEAPYHSDLPPGETPSRWAPSGDALAVSTRAIYDYLAWAYYWMRGWLG